MLNLAFLSPKLSRGIDKVPLCLCPCGFDNPRTTLKVKATTIGIRMLTDYSVGHKDRQQAAPPSVWTWYNLMLVMVEEMTSKSCPTPDMFLGQSEASNVINVSIHLWWDAALNVGTMAATVWHSVLVTRLDVMS
jgi:hypothetical protein